MPLKHQVIILLTRLMIRQMGSTKRFKSTLLLTISWHLQLTQVVARDEWNKLSQDQKDQLIAKRRQERMKQNGGNWKSNQPRHQVNVHDANDLVHVYTLIDYMIMNHDVVPPISTEENTDTSPATADTLLAYMAGRVPEGATGDIRNVLAAKREPDSQGKSRIVLKGRQLPFKTISILPI
jgi:hypothetical protein